MMRYSRLAAVIAVAISLAPAPLLAQDFFVPGSPRPGTPAPSGPRPAAPAPRPAPARPPQPVAPPSSGIGGPATDQDQSVQVQLPPVPELPPLPRTPSPPTAVIGVLGVPEVMRASTAAQIVDRVIGERREKLNEDAQKEQATWRELQQQLAAQRSTMSPEQIRTKERELQDRITNAQKQFRDRNRIIQEAAQYGVGQIERLLVAVIRQVAESRGMNLVLHRAQVALNVNEFDITEQVAQQLNKIMPNVTIPPDGVSPSTLAGTQPAGSPPATPAATPAGGTPPAGPRK
jgi:Skp family chaperone for outer membrane proteins